MATKMPTVVVDLCELNHSELVLLANWNKLGATRANTREDIIQALETLTPLNAQSAFADEAYRLEQWIRLYWDNLQMQAAKKVCPNCAECREIQNLECYLANRLNMEGPRSA